MVGFVLPKLRWLVIGAVAAGGWAVTQEPVSKRQRPAERPAVARSVAKSGKTSRSGGRRSSAACKPPWRPTGPKRQYPSRDPRNSSPVRSSGRTNPLLNHTTPNRVSGFARPWAPARGSLPGSSRASRRPCWRRSGKWRRVAVAGRKGWVHGDYLQLPDPDAPRPPAPVAETVAAKAVGPVPAAKPKQPLVTAKREKDGGCRRTAASPWLSANRSPGCCNRNARLARRSAATASAPTI